MDRDVLRDDQWELIAPMLPGKVGDSGRSSVDNRLFVEAVLYIARTGEPWRDLPDRFGNWNSNFQRFRRWAKKEVFDRVFAALSSDPDFEYAMVDGTIIRVHQHGIGAKGGLRIRRSVVLAAVLPLKYSCCWTRSAIWCASSCCRGNVTTSKASKT